MTGSRKPGRGKWGQWWVKVRSTSPATRLKAVGRDGPRLGGRWKGWFVLQIRGTDNRGPPLLSGIGPTSYSKFSP